MGFFFGTDGRLGIGGGLDGFMTDLRGGLGFFLMVAFHNRKLVSKVSESVQLVVVVHQSSKQVCNL
jgi:hypothetical protein